MLRIAHCLDSRLTDGGKVVCPTHQPHFTPQKHYFSASGTHFCWRLSKPQGLVRKILVLYPNQGTIAHVLTVTKKNEGRKEEKGIKMASLWRRN
jgi:hypothetical protein